MAKPYRPSIYDVELKVDLTKEQIVQAILKHVGYQDAVVEFDISPKGNVRGATVKVRRSEIRHDSGS